MPDHTIELQDKHLNLVLNGDLLAADVPDLQKALRAALKPAVMEMTVDLHRSTMLDSTAIGLLIAASKSMARQRGRLKVVNASQEIYHLLQSMHLVKFLNVTGSGTTEAACG